MSDAKRDTVKKVLLAAMGGMMIGGALSPSPSNAGPKDQTVVSAKNDSTAAYVKRPRPFVEFGLPTFALYLQVIGW